MKELGYPKLSTTANLMPFLQSQEKLNHIKPDTIGQASRISGVSPSDINILLVFMGRDLKPIDPHLKPSENRRET